MPLSPIKGCTCVVLAGGESRRMGQDKATVLLANDALLDHAISNIQPLFEHILISVRKSREHVLFPQLCDRTNGAGPMTGIATALEQVDSQWVFAIACDMPFMSARLVYAMAEKRANYDVVVPCVDHTLQPLAAFYSKSCLPRMQSQLESGDRSLKTLIRQLDATIFTEKECKRHDSDLRSFLDLDTPTDVTLAEVLLNPGSDIDLNEGVIL